MESDAKITIQAMLAIAFFVAYVWGFIWVVTTFDDDFKRKPKYTTKLKRQ